MKDGQILDTGYWILDIQPRQKPAFTLIELLVVVAIISVRAAMLLPALKNARDTAKRTACLEQLKQVGTATLLMADDNNGWLNGSTLNGGSGDAYYLPPADLSQDWVNTITNYLGHSSALVGYGKQCPGMSPSDVSNYPYGINMAFGTYSVAGNPGPGGTPRHSLNEVRHSGSIFLVSECFFAAVASYWPAYLDATAMGGPVDGGYSVLGPTKFARHGGSGLNLFFVDGHAQWLKSNGIPLDPGPNPYLADWYKWGDLNGFSYPYATEWYPWNLYYQPFSNLYSE